VDGDLYTGKHSRKFDYNKNYSDQDLERPEERPYHSTSRTSNGYFSKPVRRVIHDPSDRLIPIQVEHSRSIPIPQPVNRYKESRVPPCCKPCVGKSYLVIDGLGQISVLQVSRGI
jgi:hypothetical protein